MGPEKCIICGGPIPVERRKKGGKTCSVECHRLRANEMRRLPREAKEQGAMARSAARLGALRDEELLEEICRRGHKVQPPSGDVETTVTINLDRYKGKSFTFAVVSDTHLCSQYQQLSYLHEFYALCDKRGIQNVLHCGDLVDGQGVYRGQEYELFLFGADAQLDYAAKNYPKQKGITTWLIGGNHDDSFYRAGGFDFCQHLAGLRPDIRYLGRTGAYITMEGISIYLLHPDGGGAYAISYRPQKIIEQFTSDNKPNILLCGHWHRSAYLPGYRNVEGLVVPCFQAQTPYLRRKNLQPVVGGFIIECLTDSVGLVSFKLETVHYYVHKAKDW